MLAARRHRRVFPAAPGAKNDQLDVLTGATVLLISRNQETRRTLETIAERRPCTLRRTLDLDIHQVGVDLIVTDLPVIAVMGLMERTTQPVVLLTESRDIADLVLAFQVGVADYIEAGVSSRIIEARMNAALRRRAPRRPIRAEFPGLVIDVDAHRVFRDGHEVALTNLEFDLLTALAWHAGQTLTRSQLLAQVWGHSLEIDTMTVNVHVVRLRRKIEPDRAHPTYIRTVHSVGYCFTAKRIDSG